MKLQANSETAEIRSSVLSKTVEKSLLHLPYLIIQWSSYNLYAIRDNYEKNRGTSSGSNKWKAPQRGLMVMQQWEWEVSIDTELSPSTVGSKLCQSSSLKFGDHHW